MSDISKGSPDPGIRDSPPSPTAKEVAYYEEFKDVALGRFEAPLDQLQRRSLLAVILGACAFGFIVVAEIPVVVSVVRGQPNLAIWEDGLLFLGVALSIAIVIFGTLTWKQLRVIFDELIESRASLKREFEKASDRFLTDYALRNPTQIMYATVGGRFHVGQFVKGQGNSWRDEPINQDEGYLFNYEVVEQDRNRLLLKAMDPGRAGWVEIKLDARSIWWIYEEQRDEPRQFLYRVIQIG